MSGFGTVRRILAASVLIAVASGSMAGEPARPWMNAALDADARANLLLREMSFDERVSLLHGQLAIPYLHFTKPDGALGSAGYVAGIPRLGIPALQETDAGLGVADVAALHTDEGSTAMPSTMATAASFSTDLAAQGGAMIGTEAWSKGYNVLLAGGMCLVREPRNGRNFEYFGEDPLLAGLMAGAAISGIQSQHVVSTVKHFALNAQETQRLTLNAVIDEAALRESDLLAFQIAIERGRPGSVLCAFNAVNGQPSCNNDRLLNQILKKDWSYKGWVMSDWGAVGTVDAAMNGLDQQSGAQLDPQVWFDKPLKQAVREGRIPEIRIADMSRRILRSMFAVGLFDHPATKRAYDQQGHALIAQRTAEAGMVLLKNRDNRLPLSPTARSIAVIGGQADMGVMSGAGTSQVLPAASTGTIRYRMSGEGTGAVFRTLTLHPSPPLAAIRAAAPASKVTFADGAYPEAAAQAARNADVAIVFANQWMLEAFDAPSLNLPNGQNQLIEAVARANPNTIVLLQTGGAVLMPWLDQVAAVLEAWYPGIRGGEAIANVLFGKVNPSGHLPITFPASHEQLPNPELPGLGLPDMTPITVDYTREGSDVGYRWYARQGTTPLFAFGHGLSYTRFRYDKLQMTSGDTVTLSFDITNIGDRRGADVAQAYLTDAASRPLLRLVGFSRVELDPGQTQRVTIIAEPRILASFDTNKRGWLIKGGDYRLAVGHSAGELTSSGTVRLRQRRLAP